jgi:hypothetical protein
MMSCALACDPACCPPCTISYLVVATCRLSLRLRLLAHFWCPLHLCLLRNSSLPVPPVGRPRLWQHPHHPSPIPPRPPLEFLLHPELVHHHRPLTTPRRRCNDKHINHQVHLTTYVKIFDNILVAKSKKKILFVTNLCNNENKIDVLCSDWIDTFKD